MFTTKHYIRLNGTSIIKGFSDAFESPLETDICINQNGDRQFILNEVVNPPIVNMEGLHIYKYINGSVLLRTSEELQAEKQNIVVPKTELELIKEELTAVQDVLMALMDAAMTI